MTVGGAEDSGGALAGVSEGLGKRVGACTAVCAELVGCCVFDLRF